MLASLRRSPTSSWPHSINNSCCNSWHTERGPVAHWLLSHHIKPPRHIGKSINIPTIPGSAMVTLFSLLSPKKGHYWCNLTTLITSVSLGWCHFMGLAGINFSCQEFTQWNRHKCVRLLPIIPSISHTCSKEKKKKKERKKASSYKSSRAGRHSHPGGASGPASLSFEARQNHLSLGTGCMLGGLASPPDISK